MTQLLIKKCVFAFLHQGETALDTLRQWQRTYGRELDGDTRQECAATEKLLRKALAGGGSSLTSVHHVYRVSVCSETVLRLQPSQYQQLRPKPSLSTPCRTASCSMRRTLSLSPPLEGAVLPAKTVRYPNGGGVSAYLGGTEPEEQRRLFCTG